MVHASNTLDLVIDAAGGVQGDIGVDYFTASMKQGKFDYQVLLNKYFESSGNAEKIRWLGGDSVFVTKLDGLAGSNIRTPGGNQFGWPASQRSAAIFRKVRAHYFP